MTNRDRGPVVSGPDPSWWPLSRAGAIATGAAVVLYVVALWRLGRSLALVAGVIGVTAWAGTFAWPMTGEGSLVHLMLSDSYAGAPEGERAARLGVATGVVGVVCEALRPWLGGVYAVYGMLLSGGSRARWTRRLSMWWHDLLWGIWNGLTAWIVLIAHVFGAWDQFPLYDTARNGNWYDFGFLLGAGAPFLGLFNANRRSGS